MSDTNRPQSPRPYKLQPLRELVSPRQAFPISTMKEILYVKGSPVLLPTHFLYAYEKSLTGGREIKIFESQEKKNTLLIQLFMNNAHDSKLTLQQ